MNTKTLYEIPIESLRHHFKTKKTLGSGANGHVYLAKSKQDQKYYAIKPLSKTSQSRNEIDLHWLTMGECSNIVKIEALYSDDKNYYLILEYMEGGCLFDKIRSLKNSKITEREVAKMMYQICKSVEHLHLSGIAHRDIKLENLLCTGEQENFTIKLGDFGFSKEVRYGLSSQKFTAPYVAPEVLESENYGIECDIWSLGVVMFILCCGYLPFSSSKNTDLSKGMVNRIKNGQYKYNTPEWENLSHEAKKLIKGMLEVNPKKRLTITQILENEWMTKNAQVPETILDSINNFKNLSMRTYMSELETRLKSIREEIESKIELNLTGNSLFQKRMSRLNSIKEEEDDDKMSEYDNLSGVFDYVDDDEITIKNNY